MISATIREEEFVAYRILEKMEDLPHDEYQRFNDDKNTFMIMIMKQTFPNARG